MSHVLLQQFQHYISSTCPHHFSQLSVICTFDSTTTYANHVQIFILHSAMKLNSILTSKNTASDEYGCVPQHLSYIIFITCPSYVQTSICNQPQNGNKPNILLRFLQQFNPHLSPKEMCRLDNNILLIYSRFHHFSIHRIPLPTFLFGRYSVMSVTIGQVLSPIIQNNSKQKEQICQLRKPKIV